MRIREAIEAGWNPESRGKPFTYIISPDGSRP